MAQKEQGIEVEGVVLEAMGFKFQVQIPSADPAIPPRIVQAYIAGKLRLNKIRIVPGDRVMVEVSPYDFSNGRIVFRCK